MERDIRRKIDSYFMEWRAQKGHLPLVIRGARQIGKTYSVRKLGKHYESFIEINFIDNPEFKDAFTNGYSAAEVSKRISFINPKFQFVPGNTLIFFDEMQEYPDCATCLKFFAEDARYDVICSGSMMGLNYRRISSNSVGYKTDLQMYAVDFEEYLWTKGYAEDFTEELYAHLQGQRPFTDGELKLLNGYFLEYAVLGGMPAVIKNFLEDGTYTGVPGIQGQLVRDYEEDITKYAEGLTKLTKK